MPTIAKEFNDIICLIRSVRQQQNLTSIKPPLETNSVGYKIDLVMCVSMQGGSNLKKDLSIGR